MTYVVGVRRVLSTTLWSNPEFQKRYGMLTDEIRISIKIGLALSHLAHCSRRTYTYSVILSENNFPRHYRPRFYCKSYWHRDFHAHLKTEKKRASAHRSALLQQREEQTHIVCKPGPNSIMVTYSLYKSTHIYISNVLPKKFLFGLWLWQDKFYMACKQAGSIKKLR